MAQSFGGLTALPSIMGQQARMLPPSPMGPLAEIFKAMGLGGQSGGLFPLGPAGPQGFTANPQRFNQAMLNQLFSNPKSLDLLKLLVPQIGGQR